MSKLNNIKKWFWWHRWSSLICTLFLLMLCLTGLPLIFEDEINDWLSTDPPYAFLPKDTPMANLDHMVGLARQRYPKQVVSFIYFDDDAPQAVLNMMPNYGSDLKELHALHFDARTGKLLKDEPPEDKQPFNFMDFMLDMHRGLFLDLPGELFIGLMGILFVISMISGIVLYAPFMKKLNFGIIRTERSKRLKWHDLHNLLGIATAVWLLVVGITGVLNELSTPLFGLWQMTDVKTMLDKYYGKAPLQPNELSSPQAAYQTATQALPGMGITSIVFPGYKFGSPYHFVLWSKGNTPLTSQLFSPVLVDGKTGKLSTIIKMPTYLQAIDLSRPLHFGNYGGLPLKVIWALFDVVAIVVLISGVYLWFARRKHYATYFSTLENNENTDAE